MKFRNYFRRRSNPRRGEAQEESMESVVNLAAGDSVVTAAVATVANAASMHSLSFCSYVPVI